MSDTTKEEQAIEETKLATNRLDMWAEALGLAKEDLKNIKIGAIQDLAKEAKEAKEEKDKKEKKVATDSDIAKMIEKMSSGEFGFSTMSGACVPGYGGSCNTLSTMLPYLMMLSAFHSSPIPQPITVHVHLDK